MLIFFWFQPRNGWPWWVTYSEMAAIRMQKNVAGQKITFLAINTATNQPMTGDAANLTAYVSKDDGAVTVLADTSATEIEATNAAGLYSFDLAQAETNMNKGVFSGKSSTANVKLIPQIIQTVPANFAETAISTAGAVTADTKEVLVSTTIATLASQLQFTLTAGSTDDKAYNGCLAIITDASTAVQKAVAPVLQYTGATKTVRLAFDPAVFTMAATDLISIVADHQTPIVHAEVSVKSTAGLAAQLSVWMEVAGKLVPIASLDAAATCSVVVREHDSGVALFTANGVAADITSSIFEYEKATPAFTDDRQYSVVATITLNSIPFSTNHNRVVIG